MTKLTGKIRINVIFIILFLVVISAPKVIGQQISNYKTFTGWGISKHSGSELILLRKFSKDNHTCYLAVSAQSFNTELVSEDSLTIFPAIWETVRTRYSATPYMRALQQAEIYSNAIQDAGFRRYKSSQKGIDLTIDLCPSHRPLDRIVFTDLIKEFGRFEKPVPLGISITGKWINAHPADLKWLNSLVMSGDLSIVWINHTYNHYSRKNVPIKKNFILTPGVDINAEVLNTEIALLKRNILPSVFFRFPGLVSDRNIYYRILDFGLIPIGSDAWLAKGQWPKNGSIVLIHANGNEPVGIKDFIKLLKNKRADVLSKRWELFDLRESLVADETK